MIGSLIGLLFVALALWVGLNRIADALFKKGADHEAEK